MKHGFFLLVASLSGVATAADQASWLDIEAGTARADIPFLNDDGGRSIGFGARFTMSEGIYFRADALRDKADTIQPGYDYQPDPDGPIISLPATDHEIQRDLIMANVGYQWPANEHVAFTVEAGLAYLKLELAGELAGLDWELHGIEADYRDTSSETSPTVGAGINGTLDRFTWAANVHWFDKEPQVVLNPDCSSCSATWWDVRVGYAITDRWNLGVRYRDSETFRATTASLRWSW